MITIEEKLKVFAGLVVGKAQREFEQKLAEVKGKNHEIIEQHRASIRQEGEKIIQDLTRKGQAQKNKAISKAKQEKRKKILNKKQQLMDRLAEDIRNRAVRFTEQEAYESFFAECVAKAVSAFGREDGIRLLATQKDVGRFKEIIYEQGERSGFQREQIDISACREDIIGGIVAGNTQRTLSADCSITALLQEQRQLIGQKLYNVLGKAGDRFE